MSYIYSLSFFPLSKGQQPYRETCARHFDKTCVYTHTNIYNTHICQMARSSLGGSGSDGVGDGGYLFPHTLPALMQNVPHLLIYFLFPLYRSLLLASGLLHVDRRPTLLLSSKCVWNKMKKNTKKSFRNIAVFWYLVCVFPRPNLPESFTRKIVCAREREIEIVRVKRGKEKHYNSLGHRWTA